MKGFKTKNQVLVQKRFILWTSLRMDPQTLADATYVDNLCSIIHLSVFKVICLTSNFQMIENLPPGNDNIRPYSVKKLDEQHILYVIVMNEKVTIKNHY